MQVLHPQGFTTWSIFNPLTATSDSIGIVLLYHNNYIQNHRFQNGTNCCIFSVIALCCHAQAAAEGKEKEGTKHKCIKGNVAEDIEISEMWLCPEI